MAGVATVSVASNTVAVTATASTGVFTFTGGIGADVINGGAANDVLSGGVGNDVISGGAGDDTLNGGANNDTITGGAGNDTITGGTGADTMSGGAGVDSFVSVIADAVAATAVFDASTGAAIAAGVTLGVGDTITFANGLDVITDFTAGVGGDTADTVTNGAATSALGVAHDALGGGASDILFLSGNFAGGVFTVTANGAGADTLILDVAAGSETIDGAAGIFLLQGVDSDLLVAGNFI